MSEELEEDGGVAPVLSRRDEFAKAALIGILSRTDRKDPVFAAIEAVETADVLIKALAGGYEVTHSYSFLPYSVPGPDICKHSHAHSRGGKLVCMHCSQDIADIVK